MKTIDAVIEQCEEIANASKQHTLHMTHFSQSYDEWAEEWTQIAEWLKELKAYRELIDKTEEALGRFELDNTATYTKFYWDCWKVKEANE